MTIDVNEPAKAGLAHFIIDARASSFTVQAFASGILSAMGHNPKIGIRTFGGAVDFNPETLEGGAFRLTVQSGSLAVQDDISDKDRRDIERLMKENVLEVARYPEIRYEAATIAVSRVDGSLYSATVNGNLSLHGVTRGQPGEVVGHHAAVPVAIRPIFEQCKEIGVADLLAKRMQGQCAALVHPVIEHVTWAGVGQHQVL